MAKIDDNDLPIVVLEARERCLQIFREARDLKSAMFRSQSAYVGSVGSSNPQVQSVVQKLMAPSVPPTDNEKEKG